MTVVTTSVLKLDEVSIPIPPGPQSYFFPISFQKTDDKHRLIMFTKGAREQNKFHDLMILLSSTVSVHNSPMVHNTFIKKSAMRIILVVVPYEYDDLEIDLQL